LADALARTNFLREIMLGGWEWMKYGTNRNLLGCRT
jgi:hypothetical protein